MPRYIIYTTPHGYCVRDERTNLRACGPFDGTTGSVEQERRKEMGAMNMDIPTTTQGPTYLGSEETAKPTVSASEQEIRNSERWRIWRIVFEMLKAEKNAPRVLVLDEVCSAIKNARWKVGAS